MQNQQETNNNTNIFCFYKNCKSSVTLSLMLSLTVSMLFVPDFNNVQVDVTKLTMPDYFGNLTEKITRGDPLETSSSDRCRIRSKS